MLMRKVWDGPVVRDGEAPDGIAEVIITTPLGLDALGGRETRVWRELGPRPVP